MRESITFLVLSLTLCHLFAVTSATDADELCSQTGHSLMYSPFTPWFKAWTNLTSGPQDVRLQDYACWWYADCILDAADETRKQQFASTSLVLGIMPVLLWQIEWPSKRHMYLSEKTHWAVEILVFALSLGVVPKVTSCRLKRNSSILTRSIQRSSAGRRMSLTFFSILLLACYAALIVNEYWSKHSSIGCPFPYICFLWFIVGLAPATLHVLIRRVFPSKDASNAATEPTKDARVRSLAQVGWALYQAAGTLVFTSLMLVTVVELLVWLGLLAATVVVSKSIALEVCGRLASEGVEDHPLVEVQE